MPVKVATLPSRVRPVDCCWHSQQHTQCLALLQSCADDVGLPAWVVGRVSAMTEKLECDLVMRGGITSGIVYPRAIAKLAEIYNFRSIGGTSAGAIAATATAAAGYAA